MGYIYILFFPTITPSFNSYPIYQNKISGKFSYLFKRSNIMENKEIGQDQMNLQ